MVKKYDPLSMISMENVREVLNTLISLYKIMNTLDTVVCDTKIRGILLDYLVESDARLGLCNISMLNPKLFQCKYGVYLIFSHALKNNMECRYQHVNFDCKLVKHFQTKYIIYNLTLPDLVTGEFPFIELTENHLHCINYHIKKAKHIININALDPLEVVHVLGFIPGYIFWYKYEPHEIEYLRLHYGIVQ